MKHKGSREPREGDLPDGFQEARVRRIWGWVRPEAHSWFQETLTEGPSLYAAAAKYHQRSGSKGPFLRGRAPVFVISVGSMNLAVRHYFRGGAFASVLGDRYLRIGAPRPIVETLASERLRSLGIPTPRVIAAAVYPRGPFYRGDIATEFIEGGVDLGEMLFGGAERNASQAPSASSGRHRISVGESGPNAEASGRLFALTETMSLIERLAMSGVYHPDLNVKNFLVEANSASLKVHLLDLDRCRISKTASGALRDAMIHRLRTSLSKWERLTGRRLAREEWEKTGYIPMS